MSFNILDENYYLNNNPDVKAAVQAGAFASGLEHFQKYGLAEGRTSISPYFDEGLYLRKNPDVAAAVNSGGFKTGLQHYIQYGEAEGRSPGSFNEQYYRQAHPDVDAAIKAGTFTSGLQHYINYGQFETNYDALFSGSTGNDTIIGFGAVTGLIGIDVGNNLNAQSNQQSSFQSQDTGKGQVDTLIGGSGQDVFYLGDVTQINKSSVTPQLLYVGGGSSDYAVIKNFESGKDTINLTGSAPIGYTQQVVNGNLNISSGGDLIAVVEGVTSTLRTLPDTNSNGAYLIG